MFWSEGSRPLRIARLYAISIGVWSAISLLTAWQSNVLARHPGSLPLRELLLLAESRGFAYALLTPVIFCLVSDGLAHSRHKAWYLAACACGVVPFMAMYSSLRWALLAPWEATLRQSFAGLGHTPLGWIRTGFADQVTIYIAIVAAAHAYHYASLAGKKERENHEFQRALAASELQALKMQLHPHFLFNCLHGIVTLMDFDRGAAKGMVVKLSSLLRRSLKYRGTDLIALREELEFAREYLELEKMRLGERLAVAWSIDPDTQQTLVPQLILQPLMENAVRHGASCLRDGGWIEVTSRKRGDAIELRVRNSTGGKRSAGFGVGLQNTNERLRFLYSDEASFTFAETGEQTATATLVLPALSLDPAPSSEVSNRWTEAA